MEVSLGELYLAFRQAKIALYYERRGVGLLQLAKYEAKLERNLLALQARLRANGWFDEVELGKIWVVPKRIRSNEPVSEVRRIGGQELGSPDLDVQLWCSPHPDFAIVEVLYLWRFGPALDRTLNSTVIGYRLDTRDGEIRRHSRWLFEYWPTRYQEFRTEPLEQADRALATTGESITVLSADLASYYDTVHADFLLGPEFTEVFGSVGSRAESLYRVATLSLLRAHVAFRQRASRLVGFKCETGIPIGPLSSRLVANLALRTLDQQILSQPGLVCYRRYVDDFVVVATTDEQPRALEETITRLVPAISSSAGRFTFDAISLSRPSCDFSLQKSKVVVHHLSGEHGRTFIEAVSSDFQRVVSENRSFLGADIALAATVRRVIRAGGDGASPLRALRDADRVRLERFALSTNLRALERISSLVDKSEARTEIEQTITTVGRVLDSEGDWTTNLELVLRLLRLAMSVSSVLTVRELLARTNRLWASTETLRNGFGRLFYRQREVERSRPWVRLREYLHERRHEAVVQTISAKVKESAFEQAIGGGLLVGTTTASIRALRTRASLLAACDLRTRDREDDRFEPSRRHQSPSDWMYNALRGDALLNMRFSEIERFLSTLQSTSDPWRAPAAKLFLHTRPPSYFDIARRYLASAARTGFEPTVFPNLLSVVNAVRGTSYFNPVGRVEDRATVSIPADAHVGPTIDPLVMLGNLVAEDRDWLAAVTKRPRRTRSRLDALALVIDRADYSTHPRRGQRTQTNNVLLLPELSIPRQWLRPVAHHVVQRNRYTAVVGLEYEHVGSGLVENQAHMVMPGPWSSVATWAWTKGTPAFEEGLLLASNKLAFPAPLKGPRIVVRTPFGRFSVLICSELLEVSSVADLLGRTELVLAPSWNPDTSSYDHVVRTAGMYLNSIIAVANNGHYSDCRAWAPLTTRWKRDLCRLIERDVNSIVTFRAPLASLRNFRTTVRKLGRDGKPIPADWRPLPPEWPPKDP